MSIRPSLAEKSTVIQRHKLKLNKSYFTQPTVIWVRRGRKILRWMNGEKIIQAGEMVMLAENQQFDVINEPDKQGVYQADWLSINNAVIERFFALLSDPQPFKSLFYLPAHHLTQQAFLAISQALSRDDIPDRIVEIRLWELLAWLAEQGGVFNPFSLPSLKFQMSKIISEHVEYQWKIDEIAKALNTSEATLRRHLVAEKTSFREVLTTVRMMRALNLLQLTQRPISQIAYEVGYESHSRFSVKFKQHFGCSPLEVRQSGAAVNGYAPQ